MSGICCAGGVVQPFGTKPLMAKHGGASEAMRLAICLVMPAAVLATSSAGHVQKR